MSVMKQIFPDHVNLYDFGNAHGRYVYPNFESFKKDVLALIEQHDREVYIGVTNSGQGKEHRWLEQIGFKSIKKGHVIVHVVTFQELFSEDVAAEREKLRLEAERKYQEAIAARPRNAEGRLVNAEGKVFRRPYEYFPGDVIRFREHKYYGDWKEGTVRSVTGTGQSTGLKLRTRTVYPAEYSRGCLELVERAL